MTDLDTLTEAFREVDRLRSIDYPITRAPAALTLKFGIPMRAALGVMTLWEESLFGGGTARDRAVTALAKSGGFQ